MKRIVILFMIAQISLYGFSIYQIIDGSIYFGMFNMTLNAAGFVINFYTIKRINNANETRND